MGFKCPICLQDFKKDKKQFDDHLKTKHAGVGENIKNLIIKITNPTKVDDEKTRCTE